MKINFRQGIISSQVDGTGQPLYLVASSTPNAVDLNVSPTPCAVTFAHGSSDYLQVFSSAVPAAWGPVPPTTSYLYWDIDLLSAAVSYGLTTLEPVASTVEPLSPPAPLGQAVFHWFDMNANTMKIWTGTKWRAVVRVFAGVVNGSTANITMEPLGQSWKGVLSVPANTGFIATDIFSNPLRTLAGEFVTTETAVRFRNTVGTSGVLAVLPNAFVPVRAGENIPAMSLVHFRNDGTVGLASGNPALMPTRIPVGVIQQALGLNEVGSLTQNGEITYDQWDWSAHIGRPVYCGENGEIVTSRPPGLMAYRVGVVKNAKTILFLVDAETMPQVYQAAPSQIIIAGTSPVTSSSAVNGLGEIVWTIGMPAASIGNSGYMTVLQATTLESNEIRITAAEAALAGKANLVHGHAIADVTGLQLALDGKAPLVHNHDTMYSPLGHNHDGYHALVVHSHNISDVLGLSAALGDKIDKVPTAIVGNLPIFIAGGNVEDSGLAPSAFSLVGHGHAIADVTGLQLALDSKADVIHTHAISDIIPLQNELDNRSLIGHTHVAANITDFSEAVDDRVAGLLVAGTNITLNYNDVANTLTINASGGTVVNRPQHQMLLGIGTNGVNSSPNAIFNATTGQFGINQAATPLNTAGTVVISSAFNNAGWGNAVISLLPNDFKGGSVFLNGGSSDTNEDGGDILLNGGTSNAQGTGGSIYLYGGFSQDARGGDVVISGGSPSPVAPLGAGGNVVISGGVAVANGADNGEVIVRTSTVDRLKISRAGEWQLGAGADAGASGYVLTSNGVGSPVTWEPAGAGPTTPGTNNQVLASDGAGATVAREVEITAKSAVGVPLTAVTGLYLFNEAVGSSETLDEVSGTVITGIPTTPGSGPSLSNATALNGGSLQLAGSGQVDLVNNPLTSTKWTIEFGFEWNADLSDIVIVETNRATVDQISIYGIVTAPGVYSLRVALGDENGTPSNLDVPLQGPGWNRWAVVLDGSTVRVFRNGALQLTFTKTPPLAPYALINPAAGRGGFNFNDLNPCYIDNLRFCADALYTSSYTPPVEEPTKFAGSLGIDFGAQNTVLTSNGANSQAAWLPLPAPPEPKYLFQLTSAGASTFAGAMFNNWSGGTRLDTNQNTPTTPTFNATTDLFTLPSVGVYEVKVFGSFFVGVNWPNGLSSFGLQVVGAVGTVGTDVLHHTRYSNPAPSDDNSVDLANASSARAQEAAQREAIDATFIVQTGTPNSTFSLNRFAFNNAFTGTQYSVFVFVSIQKIS